MSKIKRLLNSYTQYLSVPWKEDAPAAQRVIFCVYDPQDERALRAKLEEFELATRQAGHGWYAFDVKALFATWLGTQRYAKSYFEKPQLIHTTLPRYLEFIDSWFQNFLQQHQPTPLDVVAITGVGSLFGFQKVKDVVDKLAPHVSGRLVVMFPGSYENNNYRLLDSYDGWNYHAIPITPDSAS